MAQARNTPTRNLAHEFSPRLLEVIDRPPSPLPRVVTVALLLLLAFLVIWAFFGRLDIVARAQGKLVPKTRIKVVQPFEGGRVSKILVEDGQLVDAGQILILMDKELSDADTEKLKAQLESGRLQLRRVHAELAESEYTRSPGDDLQHFAQVLSQFTAHRNAYLHALGQQAALLQRAKQEQAAAQEVYGKLRETLVLRKEGEQAFKKLGEHGYADRLAVMDRERQRIEVERDLRAQEFSIKANQARIEQAKEKIAEIKAAYRQKLLDEQVDLQKQVTQLEQEWSKQQYRNKLLELRSPEKGYVEELITSTEGTVVPAGSVMLNIVPVNEPLQAEVLVNHKDVGFITKGQTAKVKFVSYEFQKYGMIDGTVERVSTDASSGNAQATNGATRTSQNPTTGYRSSINLNRQFLERDGERFFLRPGMQVTAEIKLGSRTVMDYILSPIERALEEAGTER